MPLNKKLLYDDKNQLTIHLIFVQIQKYLVRITKINQHSWQVKGNNMDNRRHNTGQLTEISLARKIFGYNLKKCLEKYKICKCKMYSAP